MRTALLTLLAAGYAVAAVVVWTTGWSELQESGRPVDVVVGALVVGGMAVVNLLVAAVVAAQPWRERRGLVEKASASMCALAALLLVLMLGSWLLVVFTPAWWSPLLLLVVALWLAWRDGRDRQAAMKQADAMLHEDVEDAPEGYD